MRRDHLGFIFQSSNMLLDETSTTNASMGLRVQGVPYSERLQRTEETLEFLGLSDRASIRTCLPRREAVLRHCSPSPRARR